MLKSQTSSIHTAIPQKLALWLLVLSLFLTAFAPGSVSGANIQGSQDLHFGAGGV
jgi:hypothetical protein